MIWLTIGLAAVISMVALWYVIRPLVDPGPAPVMVEDDRLTELLAQKDTVLKSIKDLEFDYQVGKIIDEDFDRFNQRLRRQAMGLIQQIEQVAPATSSLDEQVEMLINRKHKVQRETVTNGHAPVAAAGDDQLEMLINRKRKVTQKSESIAPAPVTQTETVVFCTECGNALAPQHKFCANCGAPVPATASAMAQS